MEPPSQGGHVGVSVAVAARVLGIPQAELVRCDEPLPHLFVGVVRRGETQELVRAVGDAQGRWPDRGMPLLRRWLDVVAVDSLGARLTPRTVLDLLEATGGWPPGFEHVQPDPEAGPLPRGGVRASPFSVWLVRTGTAQDPALNVLAGPTPPSTPSPPGAPGPAPVSRATLERDEGGWRWRVETAWPPATDAWHLVGTLRLS
jgi:hypothetical protein